VPLDLISAQGTLADDNWRSIMDLLGLGQTEAYLVEGFVQVQTNGAIFSLASKWGAAPTGTSGGGINRPAGTEAAYGPATGAQGYFGYPLARLYVRNATAGSNATIAVEGVVLRVA